jgi:hypothetical protein
MPVPVSDKAVVKATLELLQDWQPIPIDHN